MAAGAVAGLACDSVMHPMDTIKARLQVQRGPPWRYRGIIHCATRSVRDLGFAKGLYAGFGAVFLGTAPTHALMFGAYRESARELTPASPPPYALSLLLTLATASFGEAVSLATYVPTEVVAKRMQVAAVGPGRHYRHAFHALSSISRVEGARGLYAGAAATALRDIPYTAVQLALYEAGKALVGSSGSAKDIDHGNGGGSGGTDGVGFGVAGGLGALAGGIAAAVTNPLDVVKTRLQTQPGGVERMYTGVWDCMRRVVREEGWGALGRGVGARVAWVAPSSAIVLAVFEATGRALGGGDGTDDGVPMPDRASG
ncbi:hypothetical protein MMPV_003625 [Pyropia vietnamensis]